MRFDARGEIPAHIGRRGREERQTAAGERDFRGRGEDEGPVGMAGFLAEIENVGDLMPALGQVMDRIGIVPEQAEIGRAGLHRRQPPRDLVRIDLAARVRIFRHAPHALDRGIGGERLDRVHVRPLPGHRHGDHADAEFLADREMAVIAGDRADEGGRRRLRPGRGRAGHAFQQRPDDAIMHHRETGIVADDDAVGRRAEHGAKTARAPRAGPAARRNCARLRPPR